MTVTIATGYDGECFYWDIVSENLRQYAQMHGYTLSTRFGAWEESLEGRHPYWRKQQQMTLLLPTTDWLLWLDADCMVMDMARSLEHLLAFGRDLVVTEDTDGVQAGGILLKNSRWSRWFLGRWWNHGFQVPAGWPHTWVSDNWVLVELLKLDCPIRDHVQLVSPREFLHKNVHADGTGFIMHVPGADERVKAEVMMSAIRDIRWKA